MRFLTLLACVSTSLALATKPIPLGTKQGAIDSSLEHVPRNDVENADPESVKVVRSDAQASDGGLEKRREGIAVPYNDPKPKNLVLAGVVVSFTMVGQWVRQGGGNVYRYICKGINFHNPTAVNKVVTFIANGAAIMENQPLTEHRVYGYQAPAEGFGQTVEIIVRNQRR